MAARRVWIFACVVAALTTLPYLVGWLSAGEHWEYNGFVIGTEDGNAYLGKMRLGVEGDWHFHLFFSPEATDSEFGLYLPYIALGHLVGLFVDEDAPNLVTALAVTFQIFRFFSTFVLILAIDSFIGEFIHTPKTRWFALLIATFGGGLGWLLLLTGQSKLFGTQPIEFYIPESYSFMVILALPHVAIARAAILIGLVSLFHAIKQNRWQDALFAALLWNVVGLMVTFYLAVIYAILGAWGLALWLKKRQFPMRYTRLSVLAAGLTSPLFLYNAWLFSQNKAFSTWASQNDLPSPHPLHYLIGYGVFAIFAVVGGRWAWKKGQDKHLLLVGWVLIVPILVYLPLNVQRRLAEAFFIPLVILTVVGLKLLTRHLKRYNRTRRLVMLAVLPSMLLLWIGLIFTMMTPDTPAFRSKAEIAAMDWLDGYAEPDSRVLAALETGNYLPIRTHLRPFLAHGPETLYLGEKQELVEAFYQGELSEAEKNALYDEFQIRYVMFGAIERKISEDESGWNNGLTLIYDKNDFQIYEVIQ